MREKVIEKVFEIKCSSRPAVLKLWYAKGRTVVERKINKHMFYV